MRLWDLLASSKVCAKPISLHSQDCGGLCSAQGEEQGALLGAKYTEAWKLPAGLSSPTSRLLPSWCPGCGCPRRQHRPELRVQDGRGCQLEDGGDGVRERSWCRRGSF